jgi:hypothetical protein
MIKQRRLLLVICGFIFVTALALWPGWWPPAAYANVTLLSFTAITLPEQPEIYVEWETATELDTIGFFIARSDSFDGPFTRLGDFIPHEDDTGLVGAQYFYLDEDTVLNRTYYYRLEVVNTDQSVDYYGPISATAGVLASDTATPTRTPTTTRTPTITPSPATTATTQPATEVTNPTEPSSVANTPTLNVVSGATVTPRPTSASGSSDLVAFTATPTLLPDQVDSQQPQSAVTSVPSIPDTSTVVTAVPPTAGDVAQAPAPTLVPTDAVPAIAAPVVIATEAAPSPAATSSTQSGALMLIAAAILFLGLAFVILRQVRQ